MNRFAMMLREAILRAMPNWAWRFVPRWLCAKCEQCDKGFCAHEERVWFGHEPAGLWRAERGLYHDGCLERHMSGWYGEE